MKFHLDKKMYACGTVQLGRKDWPGKLKKTPKL
jgi:hypothetical protein